MKPGEQMPNTCCGCVLASSIVYAQSAAFDSPYPCMRSWRTPASSVPTIWSHVAPPPISTRLIAASVQPLMKPGPAPEPAMTTRPGVSSSGRNASVTRFGPCRLVLRISSAPPPWPRPVPALFTMPYSLAPPSIPCTAAAAAATDESEVTSQTTSVAFAPIAATAATPFSAEREPR